MKYGRGHPPILLFKGGKDVGRLIGGGKTAGDFKKEFSRAFGVAVDAALAPHARDAAGRRDFAIPVLEALVASGRRWHWQPARAARRTREAAPTPSPRAPRSKLPARELADVNSPEGLDWLASRTRPRRGGGLRPEARRRRALRPWGCLNITSLLPRWRGAAPVPAALRATRRACIIDVVERMDAAPSSRSAARPRAAGPPASCWTSSHAGALRTRGPRRPARGDVQRVPQDETRVTRARKLVPDDGRIRWEHGPCAWTPACARAPRPGAFSLLPDGTRVAILRGSPCPPAWSPAARSSRATTTGGRLRPRRPAHRAPAARASAAGHRRFTAGCRCRPAQVRAMSATPGEGAPRGRRRKPPARPPPAAPAPLRTPPRATTAAAAVRCSCCWPWTTAAMPTCWAGRHALRARAVLGTPPARHARRRARHLSRRRAEDLDRRARGRALGWHLFLDGIRRTIVAATVGLLTGGGGASAARRNYVNGLLRLSCAGNKLPETDDRGGASPTKRLHRPGRTVTLRAPASPIRRATRPATWPRCNHRACCRALARARGEATVARLLAGNAPAPLVLRPRAGR
jgi:methionyl-tRNA formyltransferase